MNAAKRLLATILMISSLAGCAQEPEQLPPYAEVKIVIDTDLDVAAFVARLQVDLYDADEQWFFSRQLQRDDPRAWPNGFVIVGPKTDDPGAEPKELLVRIRLYPDGKFRDYRGERYFPRGFLDDAPAAQCLPLLPPGFSEREAKLLVQIDDDGKPLPPILPLNEPLPDLTIDRIVPVRVVPGKQGEIRVTLTGNCLGVPAGFGATIAPGDEIVCIDGNEVTPPVIEELSKLSSAPSLVGRFPKPDPCTEVPRGGEFQSFEDEVCIDGGLFILGDPAVFAYGDYDAVPEHMALVHALRVDRFEVTVGRFRKALAAGMLQGYELPIANDASLDYGVLAPESKGCTFSNIPMGRESFPLNCVTWKTARAFCQAMGGDLPTETQWEYVAAASGRNNRETRYAWGSEDPTCERAVYARASLSVGADDCAPDAPDKGLQALRENEAASGDLTPSGVVGMAGNVREFTLDEYRPYCARCWFEASLEEPICAEDPTAPRSVRGGDWAGDEDSLLVGLRNQALPIDVWSSRVGFRCVRPGSSVKP